MRGAVNAISQSSLPWPGAHSAPVSATVTPGTGYAWGDWAELDASLDVTTAYLMLTVVNFSNQGNRGIVQLGVGAASSEVPLVTLSANGSGSPGANSWLLPCRVPVGARLSARAMTFASAGNPTIVVTPIAAAAGSQQSSPSRLVSLGIDESLASGVLLNADDTWGVVSASTSEPFQAIILSVGTADASFPDATPFIVDVGVGASGSETVVQSVHVACSLAELVEYPTMIPVFRSIPSGSRIVVRSSGATAKVVSVSIVGVPYS